jgi:uncharacterized protein YndB with AHSA1/START domain
MTRRKAYEPRAAYGAKVEKAGERWTLLLTRELRHSPEKVWDAITDPAQLREWAPFDADRNLGSTGPVKLSTVGTPTPQIADTRITRAVPPKLLEYRWGENDMRWELEPLGEGTRLKLWHDIGRKYVAMGAAGWHVCIDVMDHYLGGEPIGRIVAGEAMKLEGWQRLHREYAQLFDGED